LEILKYKKHLKAGFDEILKNIQAEAGVFTNRRIFVVLFGVMVLKIFYHATLFLYFY